MLVPIWPRISPQEIIPVVAIVFPCLVDISFLPFMEILTGNPWLRSSCSMSWNGQQIHWLFIEEFLALIFCLLHQCRLTLCVCVCHTSVRASVCFVTQVCVRACVKSPGMINRNYICEVDVLVLFLPQDNPCAQLYGLPQKSLRREFTYQVSGH